MNTGSNIIGYPLEKYGISIVNVGSTAFLRYSRIMVRHNGSTIGVPVSVITDCDVKPYELQTQDDGEKIKIFSEKKRESDQAVAEKKARYEIGTIHAFVSPRWTLEYCIALSCLGNEFHRAVHYGKKILNSNKISLTDRKIEDADSDAANEVQSWTALPDFQKAYNVYQIMLSDNGSSKLKAIVAQCFASILRWNISIVPDGITKEKMFELDLYHYQVDEGKKGELKQKIESDNYLKYIVDAIKYATGQ